MSKGAVKADQVVYGIINTLHKFTQGSAYEAIVYFSAFLAEIAGVCRIPTSDINKSIHLTSMS